MNIQTVNAFMTDYGILWIDNNLQLVSFDGISDCRAMAWQQFCKHVLCIMAIEPIKKKPWWKRFFSI